MQCIYPSISNISSHDKVSETGYGKSDKIFKVIAKKLIFDVNINDRDEK